MRSPCPAMLAVVAACAVAACAAREDTTIVPGQRVGAITAATSHADLVALYGETRVAVADVDVGEGYVCHGATVTFGDDQSLAVMWRDADTRAGVTEVVVTGDRWRTADGVRWGLTLKELEEINGGPFDLSGFGWDYGGTVGTWKGGRLATTLPEDTSRMWLRFHPPRGRFSALTHDEQTKVSGDKVIASDHPVVQTLNPTISDLRVRFDDRGCDEFFAG